LIEVRKAKKQALAERKNITSIKKYPQNVRSCQDGMNKARSGIPSTMRFTKSRKKSFHMNPYIYTGIMDYWTLWIESEQRNARS
jgi:hypothetical protein